MILPLRVFGKSGVNVRYFGSVNLPSRSPTCARSWSASSGVPSMPASQRDERADRLPRDVVELADDGSFGDGGVVDERALDFGGRDAVAADVHHVVDAAHEPEIAVLVAAAAVAGEVHVLEACDQYVCT